jgi:hypothetical protein
MLTPVNILEALVEFRIEADLETFEKIFGPTQSVRLWYDLRRLDHDLIKWYAQLDHVNRAKFAAGLGCPGAYYVAPTCAECGQPLTSEDVEAGEEICLDCGAELLLEGMDPDSPLLVTVRVTIE